ncbi:hypothetical protein I7I53_00678 [Histoplasma capsulatum var. duboisii H88]|uniref:Uncharacterized protein n=1 Tax=Ajellomyces capsulatus (strain H88) TaxID=544711 RepID=A0A8A1LLA3_AJEC8|nr:hypothetical protein I7I53_00678 [Histoplasma capsulatum var. duboisii H88]
MLLFFFFFFFFFQGFEIALEQTTLFTLALHYYIYPPSPSLSEEQMQLRTLLNMHISIDMYIHKQTIS